MPSKLGIVAPGGMKSRNICQSIRFSLISAVGVVAYSKNNIVSGSIQRGELKGARFSIMATHVALQTLLIKGVVV